MTSPDFDLYIANLPVDLSYVRPIWNLLIVSVPNLSDPFSSRTNDGFQFAWDKDDNHFDIEIFVDGTFEWFYRNRKTDALAGTENPISVVSDEMIGYLELV